ncbi:glycosyltransferase family 4 protein [Aneurinibacillus sp. Ricciae_BoGa-3]|uniref:glycosyltransferase family 4 protein n=1 Tax=Aneurinibacillus sp. Ricciae_BoGa-3 TaxID=3022697 RepID=UPI002341DBF9|nr:glycosyltransferase family 4 protein [Aneurinibacillus sp. Ricciae_BoGa-3]WCK54876.1 glycosyltransferase family 4 protein [Aneurinibacillus sp. Ricciae_BoGa-3]
MNIFIIAPPVYTVSASSGSSVEISIYQITKRTANCHNITVFSRKSKKLPEVSSEGNLTIVRINGKTNYLQKAISYAHEHNFDCIQVENRPGYVLELRKELPNTPIILVLHSLTFLNKLSTSDQDLVLQTTDAVICNSNFIKEYYIQQFPHYANKFHCIYLGVDTERFTPPTPEEKNKLLSRYFSNYAFNVLYTGRIVPGKGIHILISAVANVRKQYPFIRLIVVGPSINKKYKKQLKIEARQAKVPVEFWNAVKPSDIHRMYWLAHCFVCPTQLPEAFGLVNVEAMACELPVIASRRGGIPEIIDENSGILIDDYENPHAFARAILKIIACPQLADSFAKKGRDVVLQKFDWDTTANRYLLFYTNFINQRSAPL